MEKDLSTEEILFCDSPHQEAPLPDVSHVISCARKGEYSNWPAIAHAIRNAVTGAVIIECAMGSDVLEKLNMIVATQHRRFGRILTVVEASTLLKKYNCTDAFEHCQQTAAVYNVSSRLQQVAIFHPEYSHSRNKDGTPNIYENKKLIDWLDAKGIVRVSSKPTSFQADLTKVLCRIVQGS